MGLGSVVLKAVSGEEVAVKRIAVMKGVIIEPGRMVDSTAKSTLRRLPVVSSQPVTI